MSITRWWLGEIFLTRNFAIFCEMITRVNKEAAMQGIPSQSGHFFCLAKSIISSSDLHLSLMTLNFNMAIKFASIPVIQTTRFQYIVKMTKTVSERWEVAFQRSVYFKILRLLSKKYLEVMGFRKSVTPPNLALDPVALGFTTMWRLAKDIVSRSYFLYIYMYYRFFLQT